MKCSSILGVAVLVWTATLMAQPVNRIDPLLEERLAAMDADDIAQIIVVMADQVDVNAMRAALKSWRASKEERHRQVVTALQQKALSTQGPILSYLETQRAAQSVESYEPMWIVNMVLARATKRAILEMSTREDVAMIYEDGLLVLDAPVDSSPASPSSPGSAEPNLRAINAHRLWDLGFAGQGSLVMNIDTGVNGTHPALAARWRGNQPGVQWYHAWYDQKVPPSPTPLDYGSTKHGSHTMGIMTGVDPVTADTIGVAPAALWIASPTIDVGFSPHTSYTLRAFQWAADPDSNVNTSNDVPDVISNSYQDPNVSSTECSGASGYWAAVDALEAIGTAVVWSAGNAGSSASSITPPKNRISSDVNFFAVGNLNTSTAPPWVISSTSSRGPSRCDNVTIKPEVVAPGTTIRSALAGTSYGNLSGTSMASPHVAGAIALLRSANPAMTGSDLKEVLLNTAVDYGTPGEDNAYGMGLIDLWAAYQIISVANPRVEGIVTSAATSDTLSGVMVRNLNTGAFMETGTNGFYRFILPDTGLYHISYTKLGFETRLDTVYAERESTTYVHDVSLTALPAPQASVTPPSMTFTILHGDSATAMVTIGNAGPMPSQLAYTLSINGGIGGLLEDRIGATSSTFSGSNLVRGNRYYASRRTALKEIKSYHIINTATTMRFAVYESSTPTGTFTRIYDGPPITTGTGAGFYGSGPISVQLDSGKYYLIGAGWQGTVTYYNSTSSSTPVGFGSALSGFTGTYPPAASITISSTTTAFYHGAVVTNSGKFISLTPLVGDTLGGGASNQHTVKVVTAALDSVEGVYTAEIVVSSNDTTSPTILVPVTVNITTTGVEERYTEGIPQQFELHQNYPNPFNPATTFRFDIPSQGHVSLRVYDILGRQVRTLVNEVKPAGFYSITFDASDLASGVYFYRLAAGAFVSTKRMMLVK